jgi:hypothetical protein
MICIQKMVHTSSAFRRIVSRFRRLAFRSKPHRPAFAASPPRGIFKMAFPKTEHLRLRAKAQNPIPNAALRSGFQPPKLA